MGKCQNAPLTVIVKGEVDPRLIPDADINIGCFVLDKLMKKYYEHPGKREEAAAWAASEEGQREIRKYEELGKQIRAERGEIVK